MKYKLYILSFLLLWSTISFSQHKADSAVNFNIPDIHDNYYDLFEAFDQGKTIVLYFFSTTCGTCYYDAEILDSIHNHYNNLNQNVEVWGIAYPLATNQHIQEFIDQTGISFPCLRTAHTENAFLFYNVNYTPQTFVTCHYMSSGNIAYNDLEFYIEGCLSTNIDKQNNTKNIELVADGDRIKITNNTNMKLKTVIYNIMGVKQYETDVFEFSTSNTSRLTPGQVYIIQNIFENGQSQTKKLLLK